MTKNNKYFLQDRVTLPNIIKLTDDITQLFYLQRTDNRSEAALTIKLTQNNEAILMELELAEECRQIVIATMNVPTFDHAHLFKRHLLQTLESIYTDKRSKWGILRGVRPIKLVQNLLQTGNSPAQNLEKLQNEFLVDNDKAQLALAIAQLQNTVTSPLDSKTIAVYVGIPFCASKCSYCSFPSSILPSDTAKIDLFLQRIEQDIQNVLQLSDDYGLKIDYVYVGGGTPTCLPEKQFKRLTEIIKPLTASSGLQELTLEAGRVDSLSTAKLEMLKILPITRISLNPQTFNDETLVRVGRKHTMEEFCRWYEYVRSHYSWQINMDLIIGLPGETMAHMDKTMRYIKQLAPDNLTLHALAFKKNADMFEHLEDYYRVDNQPEQLMNLARNTAASLGLIPYYLYRQHYIVGNLENIGYTLPEAVCMYNILIMQEKNTILGVGPCATTKVVNAQGRLQTFFMPKNVDIYIKSLEEYMLKRKNTLDFMLSE